MRTYGRGSKSALLEPSPLVNPLILQRKCAKCSDDEVLQKKVKTTSPGDRLEREADQVADSVVHGRDLPPISAAVFTSTAQPWKSEVANNHGDGKSGSPIQTLEEPSRLIPSNGGEPLRADTRNDMERRFSFDFSRVRIHSDEKSAQTAESLNARAFTIGHHVVFGSQQYAPGTEGGRQLLAHELTHVVQQSGGPGSDRAMTGAAQPVMRQTKTLNDPAFLFPTQENDSNAMFTADLSQQPLALQATIRRSLLLMKRAGRTPEVWFSELGSKRATLTTIYNRMSRMGLWKYVETIEDVWEGEPLFAGTYAVPGAVGKVLFTGNLSRKDLTAAVLSTGRMCLDAGIGGTLHHGQASLREITDSDSMHIAVGPGIHFDVHIDRYASPNGGAGHACTYDSVRTAAHLGREVLPNLIRSKAKIPGLEIFPEQDLRTRLPPGFPDAPAMPFGFRFSR